MKIAICVSGAMSKLNQQFHNQNSLYNQGNYINYNHCFENINKYILSQPYSFDFFIHSWNTDLETELNNLYNPKKSLYEDNSIYNQQIKDKIIQEHQFAAVSKALSMKKSIELLEMYQSENNFIYDLIILYRSDLVLNKQINFNNYNYNNIYVNKFDGCNGDFHFIMNYDNLSKFKNLYDSAPQNEPITHFWINNYVVNYLNSKLVEDDIVAGINQEVYRKILDQTNKEMNLNG